MPYVSFLSNEKLEAIVQTLLDKGKEARKKSNDISRNVIDPFSAIFEMSTFDYDYNQWVENEKRRQEQKTLSNFIGKFHEDVLSSIEGFINLKKSKVVDIVNHQRMIIAEIKNKHNTVTGAKLGNLYDNLEALVTNKSSEFKNYTVYYVTVIPDKANRFNIPFVPSDNTKGQTKKENELVRHIDGYSFYDLASGKTDALKEVYEALPRVIKTLRPSFKDEDCFKIDYFFNKAFLIP